VISFWKTIDGKIQRIEGIGENCWINMVSPNEAEIFSVAEALGVDPSLIRAALDEEEISYIDTTEEGHVLITVDIPIVNDSASAMYSTTPLGIIFARTSIITVCAKESAVISDLEKNLPKNMNVSDRTKFMLTIMFRVASKYLEYLRKINRVSDGIERKLYASQRNKEVVELLRIQKSLVFFSTSLKANYVTLEKLLKGRALKVTDDDIEILEDIIIEVRQAIEMSTIFTDILSGTMDAYASIVSNNLNVIMKALTVITLIMTIPTMVFSYYGMNLEPISLLPLNQIGWFPLVLALVLMTSVGLYFKAFHFSKKR